MLRTVIIEDDSISRYLLRDMLGRFHGVIEVIGEAGSVEDGINLIETTDPELVLLDIKLSDGTGFDLLDRVKMANFKLVFITACGEYALKAFKYAAYDYLLKPIQIDELKRAILRILKLEKSNADLALRMEEASLYSTEESIYKTVALPEITGFSIINSEDIIRCEGKRNCTRIIFKDTSEKVVSRTLLIFENILAPLGFIRIHRSHLVNFQNVVRYIKTGGGMVELKTGERLKVSPKHKENVLNKLLFNKL